MEQAITDFLEETFLFEFDVDVAADEDLFKAGIIDSFGYVQLIKFLKTEFNITISEEELMSNILVSKNKIIEFVQAKTIHQNS